MQDFVFKRGVYGKDDVRQKVIRVREKSDRWTVEGVELVSVALDYADGSSEDLVAIQSNFSLEKPRST